MKKMTAFLIALLCVFQLAVFPALAGGPGQFEELSEEEYRKLMDNRLEWEEIGNLVKYYNPSYLTIAGTAESSRNELKNARGIFLDEMRENLDQIDESLDTVKKQRAALAKLPESMIIDPQGTTVKEALERLDATSDVLKRSRLDVRSGISAASAPIIKTIISTSEGMKTVQDTLTKVVEGLVITYQELLINRTMVQQQAELYRTMSSMYETMAQRGMAGELDVMTAQASLKNAEGTLQTLENGITALQRNIGLQTGWSIESMPDIASLPEKDYSYIALIDKQADYQKALENNDSFQKTGEMSSYSGRAAFSLKNAAVANAEAKAAEKFEELYRNLITEKASYDASETTRRIAELTKQKADRMYALGMISAPEYQSMQMQYIVSNASADLQKLRLFQADNEYRWALEGYMSIE